MFKFKEMLNKFVRNFLPYVIQFLVTNSVLVRLLRLHRLNWQIPMYYSGDVLVHQAAIKSVIEDGWLWKSSYLGFPGNFNWFDFPAFNYSSFHFLIIKLIAFFTSDSALIMNIFYILGFSFISLTSFYVFRKLKINNFLAGVSSILYSLAPYHFYRNQSHLLLSSYYLVPLVCLVIFWFFKAEIKANFSKWKIKGNKKFWISCGILIVMAISDGYYTAFTLLLLFLSGLVSFFTIKNYKDKEVLKIISALIGIVLLAFAILSMPMTYNNITNGKTKIFKKHYLESDMYGAKIRYILAPVKNHLFKPLRKLSKNLKATHQPTESLSSSFGSFGNIGFILLLWIFLVQNRKDYLKKLKITQDKDINLFKGLANLNIFALLWATTGGFAVITALIYPNIRCPNRISIFLLFFSLVTIAFYLNKTITKKRILIYSLLILTLGVFDQVPHPYNKYKNVEKKYLNDKEFIVKLESQLKKDSAILYIPLYCFPDYDSYPRGLYSYFDLKPYIHSQSLKWSSNSMSGRDNCNFINKINTEILNAPEKTIKEIKEAKFDGIYIDIGDSIYHRDTSEKEKTKKIYDILLKNLNVEPIYSIDKSRVFFELGGKND